MNIKNEFRWQTNGFSFPLCDWVRGMEKWEAKSLNEFSFSRLFQVFTHKKNMECVNWFFLVFFITTEKNCKLKIEIELLMRINASIVWLQLLSGEMILAIYKLELKWTFNFESESLPCLSQEHSTDCRCRIFLAINVSSAHWVILWFWRVRGTWNL